MPPPSRAHWARLRPAPAHHRASAPVRPPPPRQPPTQPRTRVVPAAVFDSPAAPAATADCDVAVVGAGIGGLVAGALLARAGRKVTVFEAHDRPGGAAHSFRLFGADFDAGPSFHAGLTPAPGGGVSPNPLAQALAALGEGVPCVGYNQWVTHLPGRPPFPVVANGAEFRAMIAREGGPAAATQWAAVERAMEPLALGAASFPAAALRADVGVIATAARFGPGLLRAGLAANTLTAPFGDLLDRCGVTDPFLTAWLDLECFVLSGMRARDTICAEMAFMFAERHKSGGVGFLPFDYPLGGSAGLIDALTRGLTKHGGKLVLNTAVQSVVVEGGRAKGVDVALAERAVRKSGKAAGRATPTTTRVTARQAVLSNASIWDTARLVPAASTGGRAVAAAAAGTPALPSFVHLHALLDISDGTAPVLTPDTGHHLFVMNEFTPAAIEAPQNVVILSFPSAFDPSLAPPGTLSVHAYTAGNEPQDIWNNVQRGTPEYEALKEERAAVLWQAVERVIPGARGRAKGFAIGTPLTHARFLRRHAGTYGPGISAATGSFPGPGTPIAGLYRCGDSCAPGIGVPAAAASGLIAANSLTSVWQQWELMSAIGL